LLTSLLELCALITKALSFQYTQPQPKPEPQLFIEKTTKPVVIEKVDTGDANINILAKKNVILCRAALDSINFTFYDAFDTQAKIKQFVNQIQEIQTVIADLTFVVDVDKGEMLIARARELMNASLELVRTARITTSANDANFQRAAKAVKDNLANLITTLNTIQLAPEKKPNLGYIIKDVTSYSQKIVNLLSSPYDEALFVSYIKNLVNTARSATNILTKPNDQQRLNSSVKAVLESSVRYKNERSEDSKSSLLSSFTNLLNTLVSLT